MPDRKPEEQLEHHVEVATVPALSDQLTAAFADLYQASLTLLGGLIEIECNNRAEEAAKLALKSKFSATSPGQFCPEEITAAAEISRTVLPIRIAQNMSDNRSSEPVESTK